MRATINTRQALLALSIVQALFLLNSCGDRKAETVREKIDFNQDWRFELKDSSEYSRVEFNDTQWRRLNLPHDWSIEGRFSPTHPSGIGGGALPGGTGWYRKVFSLPGADSLKRIYVTFDGVYQNSEVYLNGQLLGKRPNGYVSFQYDLTPYLYFGNRENVIAVRVDNSDQPNSRWYSGSGIYRNVWLEKTHPIHINLWGTHITTNSVSARSAEVEISIIINNTTGKDEELKVETHLVDENNRVIARQMNNVRINLNDTSELRQKLVVDSPRLWSIEEPHLYRAISIVKLHNKKIDVYETTFGIRYFDFDSQKGFSLNGKPVKILGVCNHHDLGALGAAVNTRAIERQLELLKEMGCNGIRTSHNPPAPELLDLCDRMGFIVMNETFDMWKKKKTLHDYSEYWDRWHVQDLTDHLLRDRNHPCIFSWSIGNEILEQWDTSGYQMARELAAIVHKLAPGIPVTSACNDPSPNNFIIKSGALDLIGYNYHHENFEQFPETFPGKKFIAAETTSSLHSRGCYDLPADSVRIWPYRWDESFHDGNPDHTCSAYDNCHAPWGSTHEEVWRLIKKNDYLSGLYVWTGFDYLGEPTPYQWPSRSSYFGILDMAGFPKDVYYMYQSEWTDKDVLHVFPHWNWQEGQAIDVWAYTNYPEVEIFVNGESKGLKTRTGEDLHLQWQVDYEPGTLKAVGKKPNGQKKEVFLRTAGVPSKILLEADRSSIRADGKDLSFVTVTLLDRENTPVPHADNRIHFEVSGMAGIAGVDNGNQTSHRSFLDSSAEAFMGKCLVILRSSGTRGEAVLTASSEGLEPSSIKINIK